MDQLLTPGDLAALLQISEDRLHSLRKRHHWPCVKLGRHEIRFTAAQVEQIVAQHTQEAPKSVPTGLPGQTRLSAARQRH